jgi:hypothetical protein
MIKIYMPSEHTNPIGWDRYQSVIVDWEPPGVAWKYVPDIQDADWIMCVIKWYDLEKQIAWFRARIRPDQFVIFINVYHSEEQMGQVFESRDWQDNIDFLQQHRHRICYVDCNSCVQNQYPDVIYYDFLWERQLVYFTEYEKHDLSRRIHTRFSTAEMFALEDISKTPVAKHYLAAMRVWSEQDAPRGHWYSYESRSRFRELLRNILDADKGYVSDHKKGVFIQPQEYKHYIKRDLENPQGWFAGGSWYPAHNRYYQDSFVSVYVETITFGQSYKLITEKTYDPLIKGNFILPMGYQGMVQDILDRGFLLPDWLDHSYDQLPDASRFDAYLDSVRSLLNMRQHQLFELYCRDKYILEHNRSIFFSTPRVSLLSLIQNNFQNRGCHKQPDPSSNG